MTISVGYILGHIVEFLLFAYFANTSFYPRKNYLISNIISLCGYIILFNIGIWGRAPFSILSFFIINVALLMYCYNIKLKNAMFYSLMLDVLSCIGEYIVIYVLGLRYGSSNFVVTSHQTMFISIGGKIIYFIGIQILKRFIDTKITYETETQPIMIVIPISTIICLTILMSTEMSISIFLLLCIVFLLINFITFYINAGLNDKNCELQMLYKEYNKNKTELSEYQLLSEKYENTKIMRHDFHKQLDVLKELIEINNVKANEYMQQIQFSQRELDYAQYSDNKILNILFAQKIKECHKRGVEIHIHSTSPTLSFIADIDTVAIFSNMLDNAIEAAEQAAIKDIYVDLYTVNKSFSVVKIENYIDKEPIIIDDLLSTQKKDKDIHGIGIKSINSALKKYNSELTWTYDKAQKFFRALVMIHVPKKTTTFERDCDNV